MTNTTYLTLGEAAKETGKSKGTISKYIKTGKLSVVSKSKEGYKIDPAELFRVFPAGGPMNRKNEHLETPNNTRELEVEVKHLNEKVAMLERERDAWQKQADRVTLLLANQSQKSNSGAVDRVKKFLWGNTPQKPDKATTG